jgi:alpha-beta hydrolase superfamily lysophospholipase
MTASPAFALLHGGGQGSWVWTDLANRLQQHGASVVLLDVPGCGTKRRVDTIAYNVDDVVDELVGELAGQTAGPFTLVGHSQAGTLLPQIWRRSPNLFNRLIYLSCCAPLPGQSVIDMMGYGLHGAHTDQVGWPLDPATHGKDEQRQLTLCNDMDAAQARDFMCLLDQDNWPPGVTYAAHWSYDGLAD